MNDKELIDQICGCLDNNVPISRSRMREGLWAFRRELDRLRGAPVRPAGLKPLKGTQAEVYDYLAAFIAQHGYSPSQREIADAVGLLSASTVNDHLKKLENKGYIDRNSGRPRAIRIFGVRT